MRVTVRDARETVLQLEVDEMQRLLDELAAELEGVDRE
jgi:hypothetical protein